MSLALLFYLFAADPAFEPLPPETARCVSEVAARLATSKEPADVVADAVAQVCFFRQPKTGYRTCYVTPNCDGPNRQLGIEEMRRIKLQALVEIIERRQATSQ